MVQPCSGNQNWVCDKTKVAGIGTQAVALPNRPAESKGSGAAAAEWACSAQLEVVLVIYIS